jgi:acetylornithine/N-succinyldiaminopimelate aminotransferase
MEKLFDRESKAILQTYARLPIAVDRAEGCHVYDKSGKKYLDFLAGIAVNALGHSHPKVIEAATKQMQRYMHVSNYFYQDIQIELAEKIKKLSGYDKVFYSNSGTEAVEGAIKLARRWGNKNGKSQMIAFSGGFHGRTFGPLSLMDKPHYKAGMGPFLDNMNVIQYNKPNLLRSHLNSSIAAVILEFVQGEGGVEKTSHEFVETLFELREQHNFLIIADEIQAGAGRTGKFFGFDNFGVKPDIVTMAKGVGGGMPLGAILVQENLSEVFEKGMHGTTYGGNAVACATGMVVLDELENGLMDHVVEVGEYLHIKLEEIKEKYYKYITEVRGLGLMKGLLLNHDAGSVVRKLIENGVITNAASGYVLRMVPPLIVSKEEIDEFIEILDKSLEEIYK